MYAKVPGRRATTQEQKESTKVEIKDRKDAALSQRKGPQDRKPTLHGCVLAVWQKRGAAKVNNPDAWSLGVRFYEDVFQLYVPVEHTSGVDLDECVHQLFYYDLCEIKRDIKAVEHAAPGRADINTGKETSN